MDTNKTKKPSKKVIIIAAVILVLLIGAGGILLSRSAAQTEAAVNELAAALAEPGTAEIKIDKKVSTDEILYVNGDKTLTGNGQITMKNGGEYIIVVNEGASLTIDGPTLDGAGSTPNGVYVSGGSTLVFESGSIVSLSGHGIRVLGKAEIEGGEIKDVGTNWMMVDENAEAAVNNVSFTSAGDIGIITGAGSKLTLGSGVALSNAAGNLVYNGGTATVTGGSYTGSKAYAIHNDGVMTVTDTEFAGAETLGYIENAGGAELTVTGGKMSDSKADFIYNQGKAVISGVSFENCTSSAIESRGAEASLDMKDCTFEKIGRNVLTNRLSPVNMENITVGDCGGYVVNNSGAVFNGKNITVNNVGATAFLNDAENNVCKDFTLDTFSIGSAKEYGIRNNGAAMTLKNGTVGKTDDYSLYVKDGEVTTDNVTFAGITGADRAVIQIGQSSTPTGTLTASNTDITGGARGVSNHGTFIMNAGTVIHHNTSAGDLNYGAGVNNTGTMTINGGEISFNNASQSGGGIYNSGTLNIEDFVIIRYNHAGNNGGGIGNKGTLVMKAGYINGNGASNYGGGIHNSGSAVMYWGTLERNKSNNGGGGFVNSGSADLQGGNIRKNTTEANGGGVYTMSKGRTSMNGITVTGNTGTNGGGVYNLGSTTVTGKTSITKNTSTKNGSGIYNTSEATLRMKGGTVTGAPSDGYALYIYKGDSGKGKALISGSPNIESIYKSKNGVITIDGKVSTSTEVYMANYRVGTQVLTESKSGLIAANKAKFVLPELTAGKIIDDSGKIAMAEDAAVVAEYNGVKYTSIQEAYLDLKDDGGKGTIKLIADSTVSDSLDIEEKTNVTIDLNGFNITQTGENRILMVHGTCTLTGSGVLSGGAAKNGGGVYVSGGTFNMNGGTVSGCGSEENGAGMYVTGAGTANVSGGTFTDCSATGSGGGIYLANGSTLNMKGGTISDCTAGGSGRALFVSNGTANISGGKITVPSGMSRSTANGKISVSGGWFASKVSSNYKADGYSATEALADAPDASVPYTVVPSDAQYTVKFVTNNDSTIEDIKGTYDSQVVLPTPTSEDIYKGFAAWYTDKDFGGTAYYAGNKVYFSAEETTMYARWEELVIVATVTENGSTTGYGSLEAAFAAAQGKTATVTLLDNASITEQLEVTAGTNMTLDLGGYNITQTGSARVLMVRGTCTLTGSGVLSGGSAASGGGVYVTDGGTFNMKSGTISGCSATGSGGGIYVAGGSTANISGGRITGCTAGSSAPAAFAYNGTINISGGTFTMDKALSRNTTNGKISVTGGWFASKVSSTYKAAGYSATEALADAPDASAPYTVVSSSAQYTVKFVTNNDSTLEDMKGTYDDQVILPTPTPADEYTDFAGWYTDKDFGGTAYDAGAKVYFTAASTTLYARWAVLPDAATFTEGDTTTGYKTFAAAFAAAEGKSGTLTLLEDVTLTATQEIKAGTSLTIDLNGHSMTMSGSARIFMVRGLLSLTGGGTISGGSAASGGGVYVNAGIFNMYGGTISGCSATGSGGGIYVTGGGTANISGGMITGCTAGSSAPAAFANNGTINISGGTFTMGKALSRNTTNGKISVTGGWFASSVSDTYRASGYTSTGVCLDAPDASAPYTVVPNGKTYTVNFISEYGYAPDTATVACGTDLTLETPAYEGTDWVFDHWEYEMGSVYPAGSGIQAYSAVTLIAVWEIA